MINKVKKISRHIAVILAGGNGLRFGTKIPKQFTVVSGKMAVEYSLNAFQQNSHIDEIVLVVPETYLPLMKEKRLQAAYSKLRHIISGGNQRYMSTFEALQLYGAENDIHLLIHDAARPLVSQDIINQVINKLHNFRAVIVAMPAVDTIALVREETTAVSILDRQLCYQLQTPQAFDISLLRNAFTQFLQEKYTQITDDCGIVMRYYPEEPIAIVTGNISNSKITTEQDLTNLFNQNISVSIS